MPDDERAMLAYAKLAEISHAKQQDQGRDKLLVLAGAAACRAGWPEVAARCRDLIVAGHPSHLLARFATFADALRDEEFVTFLKSRQRLCSYERAEHLLRELGNEDELTEAVNEASVGDRALTFLANCSR
jgi:hypothetical protein